jgi:hypothetical protein
MLQDFVAGQVLTTRIPRTYFMMVDELLSSCAMKKKKLDRGEYNLLAIQNQVQQLFILFYF